MSLNRLRKGELSGRPARAGGTTPRRTIARAPAAAALHFRNAEKRDAAARPEPLVLSSAGCVRKSQGMSRDPVNGVEGQVRSCAARLAGRRNFLAAPFN
ncbi:hypothetical protein EVAR_57682_1 [Eumeta japonica]|uniref:Uncharacterized protein n=1 Tax=Eumeta variegata TaxID=151549 RepID=A0A4C1YKR0_EUMVA|nr:hypothetical protein EVAR_57682_1 [Eumeta japonica]